MRRTAAILYPGEMGCAVARVLGGDGWELVTHLDGPSLAVCDDAADARVRDLDSLPEALEAVDLVISLVPPSAALATAFAVSRAADGAARPLYLDANSVAPATAKEVAVAVGRAGMDCVDGAFVGSAAHLGTRTRLYLSGPAAEDLAAALPEALGARCLSSEIGDASALKLAFAGFNKALVALFLSVMAAGEAAGQRRELAECLSDFYPGTMETLQRLVPSYPRHAARRADEMAELAAWQRSEGLETAMASAAEIVFRRFAALGLDVDAAWRFEDVIEACAQAGFLVERPDR